MPQEKTKASEQQQPQDFLKEHPLAELQRGFQQAYFEWVRELQQACIKNQSQRQDAYANFVRNLQEQSRSATDFNQYAEAYRRGTKEFQETLSDEDLKNQFTEAYRNYLRAIQAAWSRFNPDAVRFS